jgi:hypothetical protein
MAIAEAARRGIIQAARGHLVGCGSAPAQDTAEENAGQRAEAASAGGLLSDPCNSNADCHAEASCFDQSAGKVCLCRPGFVACGRKCVSLGTDRKNCGACGTRCDPGVECFGGACGVDPVPMLSFNTGIGVSGYDPNTCSRAYEGYPERSLNSPGTLFAASIGTATTFNFTNDPLNWPATRRNVQFGRGYTSGGDPWATTSGASGLEYVSFRTLEVATGFGCLGIGSTTNANMGGTWDFPVTCINNVMVADDGPAIHYDQGGTALWATAPRASGWNALVYSFPNCQYGVVGGPACPPGPMLQWPVVLDSINGHSNVVVNPCTHNAIVAYRQSGGADADSIKLNFLSTSQGLVRSFIIDTNVPWNSTNANKQCAGGFDCTSGNVCKCGGSGSDCSADSYNCLKTIPRVHAAVRYDDQTDRCYGYFTYDYAMNVTPKRYGSKLKIVDITNESALSIVRSRVTSVPAGAQTWGAVPAVAEFASNAGWFFYYDDGTHCGTTFAGLVSSNLWLDNATWVTLTGAFPTIGGKSTLGDYIGTIKRGLGDDRLFPTWSQAVPAQNGCIACQGSHYNTRVMGARVLP